MAESIFDKELGVVYIKRNSRAKRAIARRKTDHYELTVPVWFSEKNILDVLREMKPRLSDLQAKPKFIFHPETQFSTMSFTLKIENKEVRNYHVSLQDGILKIICPRISDFEGEKVQNTIRNSIEAIMRQEAKRIFPEKIERLSRLHGFTYTGLSINKSKSRWGSCSSKKKLNLSYYCLFLPEYLIDFVILHELCHTVEMNHGERFWALLDKVTGNKARELTKDLNKSRTLW